MILPPAKTTHWMTLKLTTFMFENTDWHFGFFSCLVTKILSNAPSPLIASALSLLLSTWEINGIIPSCPFLRGGLCLTTCAFLSAHDTGLVTLQVAFNNQIISNSVVFEYKARALPTLPSSQHDWLSLDGKKHAMFFNKAHRMVEL